MNKKVKEHKQGNIKCIATEEFGQSERRMHKKRG